MDPADRPGVYNYNKGEFIQGTRRRGQPSVTPPHPSPHAYDPNDFSLEPLPPPSSSPTSPSTTRGSSSPPSKSESRVRRVYSPEDFSLTVKASPPKTSVPRTSPPMTSPKPLYTPADFDLGIVAQTATGSKPAKKLKLDTNLPPANDRQRDQPVYSPSDFSLDVPAKSPLPKRPQYSPEDFRLFDEPKDKSSADGSDQAANTDRQPDRADEGGVSAGTDSNAVGDPGSSQSFKGAGGRSLDSRVPSPDARKAA